MCRKKSIVIIKKCDIINYITFFLDNKFNNMKQKIVAKLGDNVESLELPDPREEIMPGVLWGHHTHLFTPACWKTLLWLEQYTPIFQSHRLGKNLNEEIAACLLGGYGIPAEVGLAAFYLMRDEGLLQSTPSEEEIYKLLSSPLNVGNRKVRYRFAKQKSKYLCSALEKLAVQSAPENDDLQFRSWLTSFAGVGYKTASWITRNWLDSDQVAIIDIHIHRAGLLMNIYDIKQNPIKDYVKMEENFLALANGIQVRASQLDSLIWQEMKSAGNMVLRHIRKSIN